MKTLITNGRVVSAYAEFDSDLLIDGERIAAVAPGLGRDADRVIDARGRYVIPGGIDPHTHFDLPIGPGVSSADDFESGTIAAAFGGTTTVIDFPTQERGRPLRECVDTWHAKADGKAVIDYGFHVICTDLPDERLREMRQLVDEGITSFKLLMAYPGRVMVDDGAIYRAMRLGAEAGALILVHAENGHVIDAMVQEALMRGDRSPKHHALTRPPLAEAEAVGRAIDIATMAEAPVYIVHLSSAAALERVVDARSAGAVVYAETCPQYLFLDESAYELEAREAMKYVMSPPLRSRLDRDELWAGLAIDDLQLVATDHCPFTLVQKAAGLDDFTKIPNGGPSVEHRMTLLYHGGVAGRRFDMPRFVELTSTAAAKLFGLYPRKGALIVGSDADVVIFDPEAESVISAKTHHMRVDYSAFEGLHVRGAVETVLSRGKVIVENGQFTGRAGDGTFLKRDRFKP
ncbi:MAG: dihydropyrimidinase, partial [Thermoanaerobaculia bacterium]